MCLPLAFFNVVAATFELCASDNRLYYSSCNISISLETLFCVNSL